MTRTGGWLTAVCCGALLVLWATWPDPPGHQGYPPTTVPRWLAGAGALGGLAAVAMRAKAGRVARALGWGSAGALAVSGGIVFELLAAVHVVPSRTDNPTIALRGLAVVAAVSLLHQLLADRPPATRGFAYAAFGLAFPYLLLKAYWSLGGQAGFAEGDVLNRYFGGPWGAFFAGWGTVIAALVGAATALALVRPWGERLPTALLLAIGWTGSVLLLSAGGSGVYGVLRTAADPSLATPHFVTGWVLPVVYGNFAAWGVALAVATSQRHHRWTRARRR